MTTYRELLGKVFISYSSLDRIPTRRILARLKKEGFSVWIDERQLLVGDQLSEEISTAISQAKAVLIIVSSNSIKSKWLKYELNIATERMIKGECRLIPVVIDDAPLPPEVLGILYANIKKSFKLGMNSIITALDHEAHECALSESFYIKADMIIDKVFGSRTSVSNFSYYSSQDYECVAVPIESDEGEETFITYENVADYLRSKEPLSERWWTEYENSRNTYSERLHLVLTERPVGFNIDKGLHDAVYIQKRYINISPQRILISAVVLADLSRTKTMEEQMSIVKSAREELISLARESQSQ